MRLIPPQLRQPKFYVFTSARNISSFSAPPLAYFLQLYFLQWNPVDCNDGDIGHYIYSPRRTRSEMEMLIRWNCSCCDSLDTACHECHGTGFIERWLPLEMLNSLTGHDQTERPPGWHLDGAEIRDQATQLATPSAGLRWMDAFPSYSFRK